MTEIDVDEVRSQLPALERLNYMNTGTSGPMPRAAVERMCAALEEQAKRGPARPDSMKAAFDRLSVARSAAADWVGAHPDDIALTTSTSHGLSVIASGIDWKAGDEVIVSGLEHVSGLLPWHLAARRYGIRVVEAPLTSHTLTVQAVEQAITPRTRLICMSHVSYTTGARLPVEPVAKLAAARGILLAVDGAQSVGAMPVDVGALGAPLYAFPGQKWLLGPEGTGALYVAKEALPQIDVSHIGWASIDWEQTESPAEYALHPGAQRYEVGTMDDAAFAGLRAAMNWLDGIGRSEVWARIASLTSRLKRRLSDIPGVTLITPKPAEESAGLVSFSVDGVNPDEAADQLLRDFNTLCRSVPDPHLLRFSVHFFNTEEEVDEAAEAVRRLANR